MHIERTERQKSQTIVLAPPVASLLQCCADSAQTILQTLRTLADDDLMGMNLLAVLNHINTNSNIQTHSYHSKLKTHRPLPLFST